jgi:hypothetical protein
MIDNQAASTDTVGSVVTKATGAAEKTTAGGVYHIQCFDKDGNLKWEDSAHNLVVNQGLKDMNDKYFSGAAYSATWYLGLVTGPGSGTTYAATDTLASHDGWTEFSAYTGSRKAVTMGAATTASPSVIASSSPSQFLVTSPGGTIGGAFLTNVSTGTAGLLFSASDFQSPGDRVVVGGDTLNVTYQFSLNAL